MTPTTTRTPRRLLAGLALSLLVLAGFAAVPAALPVRAATSSLAGPVLTVVRGSTSAETSGWRFSELSPGEFPTAGFSIVIRIRPYSGAADGISFDYASQPVFTGPDSLGGSASFVDPQTLRIAITSTQPAQLESFEVTGLRLKASPTAGLGPVVATYVNPGFDGGFGPLPAIATTGGATPTPTPTPTRTPAPTPTPGQGATVVTVASARVAVGRPGAYATGFRSVVIVAGGTRVTVRATVRPADAGRGLALYRRVGAGPWQLVATTTVSAAGDATVVTRAALPAGWSGPRTIGYRWALAATAGRTAATSDVARVVVKSGTSR